MLHRGFRHKFSSTYKSRNPSLEQALDSVAKAEIQISEQRRRIRELEAQVMIDPLTGLTNRRGFDEHIRRVLSEAQRHGEFGVFVFIDLDNFKSINDTLGHEAGDTVLKKVGQVLKNNLRQSDIVARLGGDEFALLLTRINASKGLQQAHKIQATITASQAHYHGEKIPLRASFGAAPYDMHSTESEIIRTADAAMYDQKKRSRTDTSLMVVT
jgi:diguanylate cyclase (GGDEF)-like protein